MELVKNLSRSLFSTNTDQRFAKSLKKVKEADQLTESIHNQLLEIQKRFKLKSAKAQ